MTDSELLRAIYEDTQNLKGDMQDLKNRVSSIEITLDNETNRNICIIAEGHAELNRKLDEALKVENEKELLLVRVNHIENELRKLKEQLNKSA